MTLPLVATINVNAITNTSASVAGSINPQGLAGSWWFSYGLTTGLGTLTASTAIAATSIPQTVLANLAGLTTGDTYYVAIVGQTSAGTVTAVPLSFVAATPPAVTNPSEPTISIGTPAVSIPDYAFPFTFDPATGFVGVVEQGSYEDIVAQVQTVMACPLGACQELPTFGFPDPTFQPAPPSAQAIMTAIQRWVPGASEEAVVTALDSTQANWNIALTTSASGTGQ